MNNPIINDASIGESMRKLQQREGRSESSPLPASVPIFGGAIEDKPLKIESKDANISWNFNQNSTPEYGRLVVSIYYDITADELSYCLGIYDGDRLHRYTTDNSKFINNVEGEFRWIYLTDFLKLIIPLS